MSETSDGLTALQMAKQNEERIRNLRKGQRQLRQIILTGFFTLLVAVVATNISAKPSSPDRDRHKGTTPGQFRAPDTIIWKGGAGPPAEFPPEAHCGGESDTARWGISERNPNP